MTIKINPKRIRPYGDTLDDGRMQLSFSLPAPANETGKEAAKILLTKMEFDDIEICYYKDIGEGFTHFVAYASTNVTVDLTQIQVKTVDTPVMTLKETDSFMQEHVGRVIKVVGACIESDAHTVGIDAIMNMKGYDHRYGLERYKHFETLNMGAQVPCEDLLKKAVEMEADVILVSQVVTQKNIHIMNLTKLIEMAEAEGIRNRFLMICGGPRISHELAIELGYDAGFGSGTYATDVASFIANHFAEHK
jgi:beta-lysine 5,6-aminomutase beta subunit